MSIHSGAREQLGEGVLTMHIHLTEVVTALVELRDADLGTTAARDHSIDAQLTALRARIEAIESRPQWWRWITRQTTS